MSKSKKDDKGRVETEKSRDYHAEQCTVCKHPQKLEIEQRYLNFEPTAEVAPDYDLSHDSIDRHARYYQLGVKRIANTERVLESLIEQGMRQITKVPLETVIESVKELHKIRGKHKAPATNPDDVEREKDKEALIQDFIVRAKAKGHDVSYEEAKSFVEPRLISELAQ